MGVDYAQADSNGGGRERRPIQLVQAKQVRPEVDPASPFTYQQQWLAEAELLTSEQSDSDGSPDQGSEHADVESAGASQIASARSWRLGGQFLRTSGTNDQNKPRWRRRLQSTLSTRSSITTANSMAPPSQMGGVEAEVAAHLAALTSKIEELQTEVLRLQNEPETRQAAAPSSPPVAPDAQSTDPPPPQPEASQHFRAASPQQPAVLPPATSPHDENGMTRTPSSSLRRRSCLPPQKQVRAGVFYVPRVLTEKSGQGLYWAIARLGDGISLVSQVAQYGYATNAGSGIEDSDEPEPEPIEYEPWELVNGKPTLAARRWREEHGPVVKRKESLTLALGARRKYGARPKYGCMSRQSRGVDGPVEYEPWELVNGKPTLAARRWREEQEQVPPVTPPVVRQMRATPARPALEAPTQPSPRHSPLPTTARLVRPEQQLRELRTPDQLASPIWVNAVVWSTGVEPDGERPQQAPSRKYDVHTDDLVSTSSYSTPSSAGGSHSSAGGATAPRAQGLRSGNAPSPLALPPKPSNEAPLARHVSQSAV